MTISKNDASTALELGEKARGEPTSPIIVDPEVAFGDLFAIVQLRRIFVDGKHFPDMVPRSSPSGILDDWRKLGAADNDTIRAFVLRHFYQLDDGDFAPLPQVVGIRDHISAQWDKLVRSSAAPAAHSTELPLPYPYVVPGGRFREFYYWDSYFTMLGLKVDGRNDLIEGMIDNFVSLIDRFGHIPNGTRSYFLSRSQPPFFAAMLELSPGGDPANRVRRLEALINEYAYWMRGLSEAITAGASEHVVLMPDGSVLNRYWDARDTPRPESFAEDVETASLSTRPAGEIYRDLRAGAESGWDFSSRWLADGETLQSIRTTSIVPADLNALLYQYEGRLAAECQRLGRTHEAKAYADAAYRRAISINKFLWHDSEGRYADWSWPEKKVVPGLTAATLFPLYVGLASSQHAATVATTVRACLLAPGGLRTTMHATSQQWDMPNGWAPLQWIAATALRRYGETALATEIVGQWMTTVERSYAATGMLYEKYNVEEGLAAGGGEYPNQIGFGWTNGVYQALANPEI